jgi:hypothetical protein
MVKPKFDTTCDKRQMWLHWVRHTVFNFWLHHIYHHAYCVCYKKCRKSVPQKFNNRLHFNQNGAAQYNKRPSLKHATPAGVLNDAFPVPVVQCVSPLFYFYFYIFSFQSKQKQDYTCFARLQGSQGPINCLAFTKDGKYLASGGRFI